MSHIHSAFRCDRHIARVMRPAAILALVCSSGTASVPVMAEDAAALAARSAIVVAGTVVRTHASGESMLAANDSTAIIKITHMYAGSAIVGDQTGREATVILHDPKSVTSGANATFFGNPRFAGTQLTIADEGEVVQSAATPSTTADLEATLGSQRNESLRNRLASASRIFVGRVESVKPLKEEVARAATAQANHSEHDPEWQVATVRVTSAIRGTETGALAIVLFPGSRDIMWFNSPKLKVGDEAVMITHRPTEPETQSLRHFGALALMEQRSADVLLHPEDVRSTKDADRVREVAKSGQGRQP